MMTRGYSTVVVHQLPKLATRVRFPLPARSFFLPSAFRLLLTVLTGCAGAPVASHVAPTQALPQIRGSSYVVQPGEGLWGIAHDFGIDVKTLAQVNRLPGTTDHVGQRLFLPAPPRTDRFLWPARQPSGRGRNIGSASAPTLEIRAPQGSFVRASRAGRVAVATRQLDGWGKTVLIDHGDGYVTVYGGLEQLLVSPGAVVDQGGVVGRVGQPPLCFEIRQGIQRRDPLRFLP